MFESVNARTDGRMDGRTPAQLVNYKLTLRAFGSGELKMKEQECSQDFSHYKSMGIFPDAQGQLTPQSLVRSGRHGNQSSNPIWTKP